MSECYEKYTYLLDSNILSQNEKRQFGKIVDATANQSATTRSILRLSQWLSAYHKKYVLLLVDEYDAPLHSAYFSGDEEYYKKLHKLMRKFFSSAIKDNKYLYKSVLTGILQLAKDDMLSGLSNVVIYLFHLRIPWFLF